MAVGVAILQRSSGDRNAAMAEDESR